MISNTKDIWRLESKWQDHDHFRTDHDRKLAEVSSDFSLNFSCAHKHSRQRSYKNYGKTRKTKGIYGKTRKPLRTREGFELYQLLATAEIDSVAPPPPPPPSLAQIRSIHPHKLFCNFASKLLCFRLSLLSHFFWAMFSILQSYKSTIEFGYLVSSFLFVRSQFIATNFLLSMIFFNHDCTGRKIWSCGTKPAGQKVK